jgi:glycosyltransferase involved in cell wall biosynthesis
MRGGIAQFNALLCRELAREHEVSLYSFTRQYPSIFFPGKSQYESSEDPAPWPARAMVDSINPWTWWKTARAIAAERVDAIIFKYWIPFFAPCFGTISRSARRRTARQGIETKTVVICDNVIPHEKRLFDTVLTRYMLSSADAFVVMSEAVLEDLRRFRPEAPAELVGHPLYTQFGEPMPKSDARERLGWTSDERVLLFFGYIRRYKGLDLLLRAMPAIHEATGARLAVLGEFYEDRETYDRIIGECGLTDIVIMSGDYVGNEEVGLAFSAADLVVLPYRSATQSGIVQVAYQLECPVVSTRVGGLEEMIEDGVSGMLIPPEDEAELVRAIRRYFHERLEPHLITGIRRKKAEMGWDVFARAIVGLVERTRDSGRPANQEVR